MRIAQLVEAERGELDRVLSGSPYEIIDDDEARCRVVTGKFTVHVGWLWRERWITSSIQLHEVPEHPLDFHDNIDTWLWLSFLAEEWPQPRSENMTSRQLLEEFERVERVISTILSDETRIKEALIFEAGYSEGYNGRAAVPEFTPPRTIVERVLDRLKTHPIRKSTPR